MARDESSRSAYVALFNLSDTEQTIEYPLQSLGLSKVSFNIRDLWSHRNEGAADKVKATLAPHASRLYRIN